jgi:hypothetical protein
VIAITNSRILLPRFKRIGEDPEKFQAVVNAQQK